MILFIICICIDELEKWEAPPISHVCKELTKVHGLIIQQKAANEQNLNQVKSQLAASEQNLKQVKDQLDTNEQSLKQMNDQLRFAVLQCINIV